MLYRWLQLSLNQILSKRHFHVVSRDIVQQYVAINESISANDHIINDILIRIHIIDQRLLRVPAAFSTVSGHKGVILLQGLSREQSRKDAS